MSCTWRVIHLAMSLVRTTSRAPAFKRRLPSRPMTRPSYIAFAVDSMSNGFTESTWG